MMYNIIQSFDEGIVRESLKLSDLIVFGFNCNFGSKISLLFDNKFHTYFKRWNKNFNRKEIKQE